MSYPSAKEINKVFYTTPRDGYKEGNLWIKRKEEVSLDQLLDAIGVSICIDGPTGTGKSSLAITTLKKKKINYILLQVTKNMTWREFCRRMLNTKVNNNNAVEFGVDAGIDKGLPLLKLHFGFKSNSNSKENLAYEEQVLDRMTDHSVCEFLYNKKITLLIDDFERASDEIVSNIGEMCKLITESYITDKTKIVIVGTDDIYRRLTQFNISLEGRLKELSLGTIEDKKESWDFLINGFNKLKLKHPVMEYELKYNSTTEEDIINCKKACYEAANGLLKSLNELGAEITQGATTNWS